jgi:hypothetical protein
MPIIATRASAAYGAGFSAVTAVPYAGPFGAYDALASVTVPSGGVASVTFAGIPTGYKHLQIRGILLSANAANNPVRFNSDSGNNYTWHQIQGTGASVEVFTSIPSDRIPWGLNSGNSSHPFATIIDILDYANTNKYKTVKTLSGNDGTNNTNSRIGLYSGGWRNTNAITSISISNDGNTMLEHSSFALYGVK